MNIIYDIQRSCMRSLDQVKLNNVRFCLCHRQYFRRCQIPFPFKNRGRVRRGRSNCAAKDTPLAISLKFNFSEKASS